MTRICKCGCVFELLDYHVTARNHPMLFSEAEQQYLCHRCWAKLVRRVTNWLHGAVGELPTPMKEIRKKSAQPTFERLRNVSIAMSTVVLGQEKGYWK